MSESFVNNINEADFEFSIVINRMDDIVSQITSEDEERFLYESIVTNLEKTASEAIKNGKTVSLPLIGCLRKNPIRQVIKDNRDKFAHNRTKMSKEEYKDYVRDVINTAKENIAKDDKQKIIIKKIRSSNKKKYDKYYSSIGKTYADTFIYSMTLLREVPFDPQLQDALDKIDNIIR